MIQKSVQEEDETRSLAAAAERTKARTSHGDSLLHLVVSKSNTLKSASFLETPETPSAVIFPDADVTRLLLEAGADVDAVNYWDNTPLHTACTRSNYHQATVQTLLSAGAHIDRKSQSGNQPQILMSAITECTINPMKFVSLKCLAARKVQEFRIPVTGHIPGPLIDFVQIH